MPRKSKGRQKVEMKKMKNESNLQVTFSKRRAGLFKKASELCTLCGAEIAIIVFSPGRKVFSFGHPCVDTVVDRFLSRNRNPYPHHNSPTMQLIEAHRNATVCDLNNQLTQVLSQLDTAKKKGEELNQIRRTNKKAENWWESPIEELDATQLHQLKAALEDLKKTVAKQAEKLLQTTSTPQHFYAAGSSSSSVVGGGSAALNLRRMAGGGLNSNVTIASSYGYNNQGGAMKTTEYNNVNFRPNYNNSGFKQEYGSEYELAGYNLGFNCGYNPTFGPSFY